MAGAPARLPDMAADAEAGATPEERHQAALAQRRAYAAVYREKNREHIRAYVRDYKEKNRDKVLEQNRASEQRRRVEMREKQQKVAERRRKDAERVKKWAEANPERVRERQRRWAEKHPEAVKASQNRYREAHREELREKAREKLRADPEAHRQKLREWRSRNKERLSQAARERLASESPEQREKRLAVAAALREKRRELAARGLPSPRTRRPARHHVPMRTEAAQKFFERERTEPEISKLRRELASYLPVREAVDKRGRTPVEKLTEWQRNSRLAQERFTRAANMARLAQEGRLASRLDEIAGALWQRHGARVRDEVSMESRARQLRGKPALDVDREIRRTILSAARKTFDRELSARPRDDQGQTAAIQALDALRASYPMKAHRGKTATPPSRPRRPPQTPRTDRGRDG